MLQDITDMKAKKYLKGGQVKIDANKDGKISSEDFKMLRGRKEMKSGGKVVKYQKAQNGIVVKGSDKRKSATSERESKLDDVRANSRQMSLERSVMAKVERGQKRSEALGRTYDTNSLSMEEKAIWDKIQKDGMTPEIKK